MAMLQGKNGLIPVIRFSWHEEAGNEDGRAAWATDRRGLSVGSYVVARCPGDLSRAKTGGIKGALGMAEDRSEASIACRQVGPICFANPLPMQEEMFNGRIPLK